MTGSRIAFLGTGLIGAPMAARLVAAGYSVAVWNRSAAKATAIMAAQACATPREAVADADFVCLCLTDAVAAEAVLFGPDGAAEALSRRAMVIDFSTIGTLAAREFAERIGRQCGADWLDCPVSGGVAGAMAGTLVMFAGGSAEVLQRARPLLDHLASRVTAMGGVGAGQATKLCNQLIVSANLVAIAEAVALGEIMGVDVSQLPTALAGGFADSRPLQLFGGRMAAAADPGPFGSEIRTIRKDVQMVVAAAQSCGVALPLTGRVAEIYERLLDAGHGGDDLPAIIRLYRG